MLGVIVRLIRVIILLEVSLVFVVLTLIRLGILLVTKGPRQLFGRTKRDKPPERLSDPSLGTHGYLHLEEVRIHYVSNGAEDKPLMLLVHGFPESWYSWRYQLKEFADNYRVVAIDQRGYGESDKPSGIRQYKMERMVNDLKQVITGLGGILTGATTKEDAEVYKYLFQTHNSRIGPINYYRAALLYGISPKMSQKVTKPVLLVWGCRDQALERGQAERCRDFADDLSIKYLENASHWVQMDEPEQVNKSIREFITKESS